jgi:non-specific serine/threonine protein kinase
MTGLTSAVGAWSSGSLPEAPLIGRDDDVARVQQLLLQSGGGIVTLTGPGGVGKTSLAQAVASQAQSQFGDRVYFVSLAALHEPAHLLSQIGHQIGVTDSSVPDELSALSLVLGSAESLLVLDNLEHLIDAWPTVGQLVALTPGLRILATSREPLELRGEIVYAVQPLVVGTAHAGGTGPAETLFLECAARIGARFEAGEQELVAVRQICGHLDGLPLAIELASMWTRTLTPSAMVALLNRQLDALQSHRRDSDERHRTMRAAIAWSYDLLDLDSQRFFRAVATFNGTFEAAAAAYVAGSGPQKKLPDVLSTLNDIATLTSKNLMRMASGDHETEARYELLETIRAFGRERAIDHDESDTYRNRHAAYFVEFMESMVSELLGPDRIASLERLDREYPNLRAALAWLIESEQTELAHRMVAVIWRYWEPRGLLTEGRSWSEAVFNIPGDIDPAVLAAALYGAGVMPFRQGDFELAASYGRRCLAIYTELQDSRGISSAFNVLGIVAYERGLLDEAIDLHRQSLAIRRELGDPHLVEMSLVNLALALLYKGELDEAGTLYREAYDIESKRGDTSGIAYALNGLGLVAEHMGKLDEARACHDEAIALRRGEDTGSLAASLVNLAGVLHKQGDLEGALAAYQEGAQLRFERGEMPGLLEALRGIASLARESSQSGAGVQIERTVVKLRDELGIVNSGPSEAGESPETEGAVPSTARLSLADAFALAMSLTIVDVAMDNEPGVTMETVSLTNREKEVLLRIVDGLSDQEIADVLFIARTTVSRHVANIFAKLDVTTRTAAASWATRHQLR